MQIRKKVYVMWGWMAFPAPFINETDIWRSNALGSWGGRLTMLEAGDKWV